ncbi:Serine phosphatase RsbU, regulator of sigma subunit [Geodermatophilus amargosae]|uniref:Serine phosphatase RsbU, regulator of sigma subunit n=1 Tax=Geodermatophilus amargosae TaxID=1296565 RepID=A0A1I7B175_9ACTN|nr:PP2C family protein-serine/threonine phosphatase [Geodermatophilus amargosae]SFT80960.1 Serine phosphatase RsbU, regulator of sigma subunit [Geodermatophilus amargosae]
MPTPPVPGLDVGALLDRVMGTAPIEAVEATAGALAEMVGARGLAFLIADFSGRAVVRLTVGDAGVEGARAQEGAQAETLPLSGTVYERVLRTQQIDVQALDDGARVIAPVTDRGDAIGLLELVLPRESGPASIADVAAAAHALAYVVIAARRYTDVFEWGQRTTPFSLAAEIQRRLLPASYTCEAGQFTLAGWLEPAASVGGDTFDFTLNNDVLHVSITDAVGHEVEAALLATLLVGALRNARRTGMDLDTQARYANDALTDNAAAGQFVTGQLVRVDLSAGTAGIVNAGHPFPLLVRDGRVREIGLEIEPPFGVVPARSFQVQRLPLEPGDRIVFLTDGMQERNAAVLDVAAALRDTTDLHPREVVQELGAAVLRATGGDLRDDATMVCLDWYGGPPRRRAGANGADTARASSAGRPSPGLDRGPAPGQASPPSSS